jgi:predicted nucleotidyltransferase
VKNTRHECLDQLLKAGQQDKYERRLETIRNRRAVASRAGKEERAAAREREAALEHYLDLMDI